MQPSSVSIVLPTFNRLEYLRPTVDSVFAQSWQEWDLVVVDDGSDEQTRSYLRELERRARVKVIWLSHVGWPAAVRNAGLRQATGEHVAFLDSDDLWTPRKLEIQMATLREHSECRWSYTAFARVDHLGEILPDERTRPWHPYEGEIFEQLATSAASVRTPSVVATRQLLAEAGGFDESIRSGEDYDLWMRLALRSPVAVVDEPLVQVRLHDHNLSRDWAAAFHGRDRSLAKMQGLVAPASRALLRRERARNATRLLAEHALRGEREEVLRSAVGSLPYSWRYLHWWWGALRAAARPYVSNKPRP